MTRCASLCGCRTRLEVLTAGGGGGLERLQKRSRFQLIHILPFASAQESRVISEYVTRARARTRTHTLNTLLAALACVYAWQEPVFGSRRRIRVELVCEASHPPPPPIPPLLSLLAHLSACHCLSLQAAAAAAAAVAAHFPLKMTNVHANYLAHRRALKKSRRRQSGGGNM